MSMPTPAITQAITAPSTPVACAKLRGSEKTPAPTIDPTTIAVRVINGIFCDALTSVVVIRGLRS
jgi:hypothetical protein